MKTIYQYITFLERESTGKTSKWACRNKKSEAVLGEIKWYGAWRQYCYFPTIQAVYSAGCLNDISDFIEQLNPKI